MVFPLVILSVVVFSGFFLTSSMLNQGLKTQIFQTDNEHLSFIIASSAIAKVMGKIHSNAWEARPFKNSMYSEFGVSFNGGTYDVCVEDSPGQTHQADVYVRTTLGKQVSLSYQQTESIQSIS